LKKISDVYHGLSARKVRKLEFEYVVICNGFQFLKIPESKMDLQEVGKGFGDWMELAQDRDRWRALVSKVMNFRVP